jgi:hypothetical protein
LESVASVAGFQPYRCHECKHRFLSAAYLGALTSKRDKTGGAIAEAERDIRATRSSLEWKRKRRDFLILLAAVLLFLAFLRYITREKDVIPSQ